MTKSQNHNWNPDDYAKNARFVSDLGMPVVALLNPQPGERILDLGCGDGALTLRLLEAGCAVVGVDASKAMVSAARKLGIDAREMSGEHLEFEAEFDAVFSNAALHWMQDHDAVLQGVFRALKPGGRFVAEFGGYGNVAAIVEAFTSALQKRGLHVQNPWFFPSPGDYRSLLNAHGFQTHIIQLIPRPTPLPGDIKGWLHTFTQSFYTLLPLTEQHSLLDEVVDLLRPRLFDPENGWEADYVRLRFAARKKQKT